jgi:L-rhamnose isomerase
MVSAATNVEAPFEQAKEQYAEWGIDVEAALDRLATVAISRDPTSA